MYVVLSSLMVFYILLNVNKSNEKTKTNNELLLLASVACVSTHVAYSSLPQTTIGVQKLIKTHKGDMFLHYIEHGQCSLFKVLLLLIFTNVPNPWL